MNAIFKSSKVFRWIAWEEETNRLELEGVFTSKDLKNLAQWLDSADHPVISDSVPVIKVQLDPL